MKNLSTFKNIQVSNNNLVLVTDDSSLYFDNALNLNKITIITLIKNIGLKIKIIVIILITLKFIIRH